MYIDGMMTFTLRLTDRERDDLARVHREMGFRNAAELIRYVIRELAAGRSIGAPSSS